MASEVACDGWVWHFSLKSRFCSASNHLMGFLADGVVQLNQISIGPLMGDPVLGGLLHPGLSWVTLRAKKVGELVLFVGLRGKLFSSTPNRACRPTLPVFAASSSSSWALKSPSQKKRLTSGVAEK